MALWEDIPATWWRDPVLVLLPDDDSNVLPWQRPEWHQRALCRGQMSDGHSAWFSGASPDREHAAAVCLECPVRDECDQSRQPHGVWAGTHGGAHDET